MGVFFVEGFSDHRGAACSSQSTAIPRLPIDTSDDPFAHRDKIGFSLYPDNLCVARAGGKAEIDETPAAKEAMRKEWGRLRSKYVLDEGHPRDLDDVRAEARRGGGGGTRRAWVTSSESALRRTLNLLRICAR